MLHRPKNSIKTIPTVLNKRMVFIFYNRATFGCSFGYFSLKEK